MSLIKENDAVVERRSLVQEVAELLRRGNVLLQAYPGWGKTRLATLLASEFKRVVIVERTIEEMREVALMSPVRVVPLYGREKVCPLMREAEDGGLHLPSHVFCRVQRLFSACRYKYEATSELARFHASAFRSPDELIEEARRTGVCPYPTVVTLKKSSRVVATYGFVFHHGDVLEDRDLVVFDEAHTLVEAVAESVKVYDEQYVEFIVEKLKRSKATRGLAYAVKQCWRRSSSFREFAECLERQPVSTEEVDELIREYRSKRSYAEGKALYVVPSLQLAGERGALFLSSYVPPFILDHVPNATVIDVPPPSTRLRAIIDDSLTSRYRERRDDVYRGYAEKIAEYASSNEANLVLFPSYEFMERVKSHLPSSILSRVVPREVVRTAGPGDIVFDVAGGTTTEGINPSPHLRRVIVCGLPYPPPSPILNALASLYGFDNVYTYMALQRVVQAIGRTRLRAGSLAVLIDRRYRAVLRFFPSFISVE
ncbi:MAG: helicase C-terminal domain-containing protein [Thermofilaceae archaeon]